MNLSVSVPGITVSDAATAKARDFIENEKQFQLGFLPTEQSNPITATLEEDFRLVVKLGGVDYERAAQLVFAAQEWVQAQDWSKREEPSPVQVVLKAMGRA